MKEIKDYLHLYLGCDIQCPVSHSPETNGVDKLDAAFLQAIEIYPFDADRCKPILRPLSDMTEEEAEYFAWLCMDSEHHLVEDCRVREDEIQIELAKNDDGLQLDNDVEIYIGVSCRCFEGYVAIMKDGKIGICEEDEPSTKMMPLDAIASKVAYLISKHFDLFGLIESGLAIDKTKMP